MAGLPALKAGSHARPEHGACLLEYVSVLAGERLSDHPRCVDRRLARRARAVNDLLDDTTRPRLALLAPALIGTATPASGRTGRWWTRVSEWRLRPHLRRIHRDRAAAQGEGARLRGPRRHRQ